MKIICIGQNYFRHALEMNSTVPANPMFFLKPDSAYLRNNHPFFLPDFSNEIHHEIEIVVKISRLGKCIEPQFAHRYYDEIGLGIDFTARDLQRECIANGWPWEMSKAFDQSACVGEFMDKSKLGDLHNIDFSLTLNGKTVQQGNTADMAFYIDDLIAYISKFMTLKIGDLIFTGTPQGIGPVHINDQLEGFIGNQKMLECRIK
ncbi:MAG: fumarylacetoacetate hydrolase family protein [Bacteroidota bacterium]|nr:fumarylacetoacetate hydrolase family protein [Bacteroidota bacterium]MDP4206012.1 fumarylacetoacetate hydrolase family protein [Bacteroidota bacterium]